MPTSQTETSLLGGFINSLTFPFKPGMLVYNVLGAVLIGIFLATMLADFNQQLSAAQSRADQVSVNANVDSEMASKLADIEEAIAQMRDSGMGEEDIEEMREFLLLGATMSDSEMDNLANNMQSSAYMIMPLIAIIYLIIFAKNLDLTAQIADGDFDSPSFSPFSYVSPFIVLKSIAVAFLLFLALIGIFLLLGIVSAFIPFAMLIIFPLYLILFLAYPAMVLTLIRTNSVFGTINVGNWMRTINDYVGQKNYLILLGLLFVVFVISFVVQLFSESSLFSGASLVVLFATITFSTFVLLHLLSANHFLMGFMTQHETAPEFKGDFSGYEKKASNKKAASIFDEAESCLKAGHPEDAISLLKQELVNNQTLSPEKKLSVMMKLLSVQQSQDDQAEAKQTQKRIVHLATKESPGLKSQAMPHILALTLSGDYKPSANDIKHVAKAALQERDFTNAFKLAAQFIKSNPDHANTTDCYIIAARALVGKRDYIRAHKLFTKVLQDLPQEDPRYMDVKSERAMVKRKAQQTSI